VEASIGGECDVEGEWVCRAELVSVVVVVVAAQPARLLQRHQQLGLALGGSNPGDFYLPLWVEMLGPKTS